MVKSYSTPVYHLNLIRSVTIFPKKSHSWVFGVSTWKYLFVAYSTIHNTTIYLCTEKYISNFLIWICIFFLPCPLFSTYFLLFFKKILKKLAVWKKSSLNKEFFLKSFLVEFSYHSFTISARKKPNSLSKCDACNWDGYWVSVINLNCLANIVVV